MTPHASPFLKPQVAAGYDQDRFSRAFGAHLREEEVATFLQMVNGCRGRILDVGVGTGKLTIPLMKEQKQVVSLDYSVAMMGVAQQKARAEGLHGAFFACDAQSLCFQDLAFECAVSSRVLMHVKDWRRAIAELCRVAQRTVIIDFPRRPSLAAVDSFVKKVMKVLFPSLQAYRVFALGEIQQEFEKHQFQTVEIQPGYVLPIALHRWLNRPTISRRIEQWLKGWGLAGIFGSPVTVKVVRG